MAKRGRPTVEIALTGIERRQLESWARRHSSAQALVMRCRIILACADPAGLSRDEIAARVGCNPATVTKWRRRFAEHRLDGLIDEPRPGAARTISDEVVEQVVIDTLETTPKDATHWSTRSMAQEEAATVPYGAIMAWGLLRKIGVQSGQRVLVVGASGGIGPAVVQLAVRQFGAVVTGVCGPANVDYVGSLGAATVIDYTKDDFLVGDASYDVIVDILGRTAFGDCKRVLVEGGQLVYVSFKMHQVVQMVWTSIVRTRRVRCVLVSEKPKDLDAIRGFVENGTLRPRVDKAFPLEQCADAHRYAKSGARRGAVVITVV